MYGIIVIALCRPLCMKYDQKIARGVKSRTHVQLIKQNNKNAHFRAAYSDWFNTHISIVLFNALGKNVARQ